MTTLLSQPTRTAPLALAAGLVGAALLAAAPAAEAAPKLHAPKAKVSWRAELIAPVVARKAPRRGARKAGKVSPFAKLGGDATVLLVTGAKKVKGEQWVRVLLPGRPNGRKVWILADTVRLRKNFVRVQISLKKREITVFKKGKRVMRRKVVVGKSIYPTPRGKHAISESIRTNAPRSYLGPWVLPLTAHSEKLNFFAGGDGQVALHGTNQPGLLGSAVSHGCIRLKNSDIARIAKLARPGTPVTVR